MGGHDVSAVQAEVGDRYRVTQMLGAGGGGETFEATDARDGSTVALKRLVVAHTRDWKTVELFEREARVLGALHHPAIPRLRDTFFVDGERGASLYLVHDLAPGRSLRQWIEAGLRPTEAEVRAIAHALLEVLAYLHGANPPVIHRDVKPENVIRAEDGRIALVDFGAVTELTLTMTGGSTVVGTYGYMAPEQFRGQAMPASDVYGVAATMLYLLTGRSPTDLPQEKLKVRFRQLVSVSPHLASWLDRALEPAPEDRFPSAPLALAALEGRAPIKRSAKASSGNLAILCAALGVVVAGLAGVALYEAKAPGARAAQGAAKKQANRPLTRLPERPYGFYRPLSQPRSVAAHTNFIYDIAVSPDDKTLVTASEGGAKIWDAESVEALRTLGGHDGKVGGVAFTKDGAQIVSGGGTSIRVWEASTGKLLRTIDKPHQGRVTRSVLSPDDSTIFSASDDGSIKAWDFATGRELREHRHGLRRVLGLAVSPDGSIVVAGGDDGVLKSWDARTGALRDTWQAHASVIGVIAFSPDGMLLASAGDDNQAAVWAMTGGQPSADYAVQHDDQAWGVGFSPDGRYLASTSRDGILRLDEPGSRSPVTWRGWKTGASQPQFTHDGRVLFVGVGSWLVKFNVAHRRSGTKLPEPGPDARPKRTPKSPAHAAYLEAMRIMWRAPETRLSDADAIVDAAIARDPKAPLPWIAKSRIALKRAYLHGAEYEPKGVAAARAHLDHAGTLGPKGPEWWAIRVWFARAEKDNAAAHEAARQALTPASDDPDALLGEAQVDLEESRYAHAVEVASRVMQTTREPEMVAQALHTLGDGYAGLGDIDAADAAHKRSLALSPRNPWALGRYGWFLLRHADDPEGALAYAQKAREVMDHGSAQSLEAEAHLARGNRLLWNESKDRLARREFDQAIALDPTEANAFYGRAACSRLRAFQDRDPKRVDEVKADLEMAMRLDPDAPHIARAWSEIDAVRKSAKTGGPPR